MPRLNIPVEINNIGLIAISSPLKDYRVSWLLNQLLGLEFTKREDIIDDIKQKTNANTYGLHATYSEEYETNIYLLGNKSIKEAYIKSLKKFDYLLILENNQDEFLDHIFEGLKNAKGIQIVIKPNNLSKNELLKLHFE